MSINVVRRMSRRALLTKTIGSKSNSKTILRDLVAKEKLRNQTVIIFVIEDKTKGMDYCAAIVHTHNVVRER
jgi:hypothetical protein